MTGCDVPSDRGKAVTITGTDPGCNKDYESCREMQVLTDYLKEQFNIIKVGD